MSAVTVATVVIAGILGLAVGSFLNVAIHRVPEGRSVLRPASACPACGARVRWVDNVPIVSWLALRGRCRDCGERISVRYPLVEAGTAVAFALVAACFAPDGWLAPVAAGAAAGIAQGFVLTAYLVLASASIALTAIDLETRRLPDAIVLPSVVALAVLLAATAAATGDLAGILRALGGGLALFALYLVIALVSRGGMGFGDVKLAALLGLAAAWIGWDALVVAALAAFVLGGLYAVALLAVRRARRGTAVPFGPWMIAGAWLGIVAGPFIWQWYGGALGIAVGG